MKFLDKIKRHFHEVLELKTHPKEIALGFAIGTFFTNMPTLGLEIVIILLILMIFKKVSKIGIVFSYVVWNPLVTYPLGAFSYYLGNYLLRDYPITLVTFPTLEGVVRFTLRYVLGSFIVSLILTIISYFVILYLVEKYQNKEIPVLQKPVEIFGA